MRCKLPPVRRRAVLLAAALIGLAGGRARAAPPAERPLAAQVGRATAKVERGVQTGSLVSKAAPGDPLGLIGAFQLDYALSTLVGEPVEDYKFRWELAPTLRFPGGETTTVERVRRDEPDLYARLAALTPESVTLRARVRFFGAPSGGTPFAEADLDLTPDVISPSGRPQGASAPASPAWGDWFSNLHLTPNLAEAGYDASAGSACARPEDAACAKEVWARAKRVELASATVTGVEWPEVDTRQLLAEIWSRHHRAEQKARDRAASDAAFWATPALPPMSLAAARELPTVTVAKTTRALDKRTREARRLRFQQHDRASFAVSVTGGERGCGGGAELRVDVHGALGAAAPPTVLLEGKRLAGKTEASDDGARHTFAIPFVVGTRALEIDLAAPRPVKRLQRVSCINAEAMVPCLGASDCPTVATCPCRLAP
jgi:hypothetical protein